MGDISHLQTISDVFCFHSSIEKVFNRKQSRILEGNNIHL